MDHSVDLGKKQALEKLASFIFECHYRRSVSGRPVQLVKIPIRHCDLGEYLGLQPETVSRGFRDFQERKIIRLHNASEVEIKKLPSLKRIANGAKAGDENTWQNGSALTILDFRNVAFDADDSIRQPGKCG